MLIFTNRELEDRADESALQRSFASGSPRLALATVERAPQGRAEHWNLTQPDDDVDDADSLRALLPLFQGSLRLLVYLHGYNNTPAACFERCALLQSLYDGTTWSLVGFSWASEGCLSDGSDLPGLVAGLDDDETDLKCLTARNRTESGSRWY